MRCVLLAVVVGASLASPVAAKIPPAELFKPYTPTFGDWVRITMWDACADKTLAGRGIALFGVADDNDPATYKFTLYYFDTEPGRKWRDDKRAQLKSTIESHVRNWTRLGYAIAEDDFTFETRVMVLAQ